MAYRLYLIRNTRDTDLYYAEHGEIGGVPDAVGYDEPPTNSGSPAGANARPASYLEMLKEANI